MRRLSDHSSLSEHIRHHVPVDICETEVATGESIGEVFVLDSEAVQDGGLQIVNMDGVFGDVVGEIVSFPVL